MSSIRDIALAKAVGGGSGPSVTVEELNVVANGEYTAETGKAYSPVNVAVPQTTIEALTVTQNGTYTAPTGKAYSPVTVNVAEGATILYGDDEPLPSQGNNGDIYLKTHDLYYYDSELNWSCYSAYYVSSTDQRLCTQSVQFYKLYEGGCIAVYLHRIGNNYYGPILVSTVEDNVKYTNNATAGGSVVIDGVTWYYSTTNYWSTIKDDTASIPLIQTANAPIADLVPDILAAANYHPGNANSYKYVAACRLKVSGAWQDLIGSNVDDVGGVST